MECILRVTAPSSSQKLRETHTEKLMSSEATKALEKEGFQPVIPPEIKAKRSIICQQVDSYLMNKSTNDIADEIENHQAWAKVESIHKFPIKQFDRSGTLKITFEDAQMAAKAQSHGLRLFNMSVADHQIQEEKYIHLLNCLRCYSIEDHTTKACPKDKNY